MFDKITDGDDKVTDKHSFKVKPFLTQLLCRHEFVISGIRQAPALVCRSTGEQTLFGFEIFAGMFHSM